MEKLLVISDEPALALTLADELPHCEIVPARMGDWQALRSSDIALIITEKESVGTIALLEKDIPHLTLTRPVRLRELLYTIGERLQAQSRPMSDEVILAGNDHFSPRERMLISKNGDQRIALTEKENELFALLLAQGDAKISREQLLKQVWGYNDGIDTHTLETHIYRLRGKLRLMDAGYDIVSSDEGGYNLKIH